MKMTLNIHHYGSIDRSSHPRCSVEKSVLKNFTSITGKLLCLNLSLIKFINFIKKRLLQHKCFPVNIVKFSKTLFLKNICERLLLKWISRTVQDPFMAALNKVQLVLTYQDITASKRYLKTPLHVDIYLQAKIKKTIAMVHLRYIISQTVVRFDEDYYLWLLNQHFHYVKSVRIRSYSGPYSVRM